MKKTGSATAAAAIAMHGFRMEVLAQESGSCTRKNFNLGYTYTQTKTWDFATEAESDAKVAALFNAPASVDYTMSGNTPFSGYGCGVTAVDPPKIRQTGNRARGVGTSIGNTSLGYTVTHTVTFTTTTGAIDNWC